MYLYRHTKLDIMFVKLCASNHVHAYEGGTISLNKGHRLALVFFLPEYLQNQVIYLHISNTCITKVNLKMLSA